MRKAKPRSKKRGGGLASGSFGAREVAFLVKTKTPAVKAGPLIGFTLDLMDEMEIEGSVAVELCSVDRIAGLNEKFRHKQGPTDVLAFECGESDESGLRHLGDLVICPRVAQSNGKRLGHSLDQELRRLLLHGLLHLCGYDHETDKGRMSRKERALCRKLGLPE